MPLFRLIFSVVLTTDEPWLTAKAIRDEIAWRFHRPGLSSAQVLAECRELAAEDRLTEDYVDGIYYFQE